MTTAAFAACYSHFYTFAARLEGDGSYLDNFLEIVIYRSGTKHKQSKSFHEANDDQAAPHAAPL